MARQDIDRPVQQPLLDRLIDDDPRSNVEPPLTRSQSVRALKAAVRRDLEWLLNSRAMAGQPEGFEEAGRSVIYFGIPDVTSLSGDSTEDRVRLLRMIETAIETYEPRLANIRITESDTSAAGGRQIRFLVQGLLRMDPSPEQVFFDTVLDLAKGDYEIKGD